MLTFQLLTNKNCPYLPATEPEAFLVADFFFQLPTSVQRQGFLNSRLPLLQQQNGARENQTNPVDTEQQLLSSIINKIDY